MNEIVCHSNAYGLHFNEDEDEDVERAILTLVYTMG